MQEDSRTAAQRGDISPAAGRLPWHAIGQGALVIDLTSGISATRFHQLLAERFHAALVDTSVANSRTNLAILLRDLAASLKHQTFSLILRGSDLDLGLAILREQPGRVDALVILAPPAKTNAFTFDALAAAARPLLVLSGTRGVASPPEAGSPFRAHVPGSHYVLVYDAGDTIEADRPEATASVIGDFLTRRESFIVAHTSGLIHP